MSMAIRFYSWPQSSGTGAHWALEELGLPYEYVRLDRAKGEHRAAAYLAINPNGKIPALVDGEERYFESLAILLHLAERYGATKGLWPAGARERAEAFSWTTWSATELLPFMLQYIYHGLDAPMSFDPPDRSKAAADYSLANSTWHLDMLENRLRDRTFIMGAFSLVDIPIAATLGFGTSLGVSLGQRQAVRAWLDRCGERPARARAE
jgi:glutathione S-transferase